MSKNNEPPSWDEYSARKILEIPIPSFPSLPLWSTSAGTIMGWEEIWHELLTPTSATRRRMEGEQIIVIAGEGVYYLFQLRSDEETLGVFVAHDWGKVLPALSSPEAWKTTTLSRMASRPGRWWNPSCDDCLDGTHIVEIYDGKHADLHLAMDIENHHGTPLRNRIDAGESVRVHHRGRILKVFRREEMICVEDESSGVMRQFYVDEFGMSHAGARKEVLPPRFDFPFTWSQEADAPR